MWSSACAKSYRGKHHTLKLTKLVYLTMHVCRISLFKVSSLLWFGFTVVQWHHTQQTPVSSRFIKTSFNKPTQICSTRHTKLATCWWRKWSIQQLKKRNVALCLPDVQVGSCLLTRQPKQLRQLVIWSKQITHNSKVTFSISS